MMDVLAHTIIEVSVQNQGLLVGFDAFCDFSIGLLDFWKCSRQCGIFVFFILLENRQHI
jgi:hypothetical protein